VTTLFVGGPEDGSRFDYINPGPIRFRDSGGSDTIYMPVTIAGSSTTFTVYVPSDWSLDGDRVIQALIKGYKS
jgi:hypothetical protein